MHQAVVLAMRLVAKACPWCGDGDVEICCHDDFYCVECNACAARGPVSSVSDDEDEPGRSDRARNAAVAQWNAGAAR